MADSDALLPTGMMDQMSDTAEQEAQACSTLQSVFASFGYRLVNPPMLEFEETLLAEGAGKALSTNTFRLMYPVSQRMMALRSDATAQIARISASRLKSAARPLRLSYIADVLRIRSTQLRPERQFRQAGCELIGSSENAPSEIALVSLLSLSKIGVGDISIDFTAPEIIRILQEGKGDKEAIRKACERRDRAAFGKLGAPGKTLIALDEMSGPAKHFLREKARADIKGPIGKILNQLESAIKDLQKALQVYGLDKDIAITVDPIETRGFEYQSFPCFTLFAKGIAGELGRGGAYTAQFGDYHENACGFTLYMDSVLRALPRPGDRRIVIVPENTAWKDILALQEKGLDVLKCNGAASEEKARDHRAAYLFKNGKLKEI